MLATSIRITEMITTASLLFLPGIYASSSCYLYIMGFEMNTKVTNSDMTMRRNCSEALRGDCVMYPAYAIGRDRAAHRCTFGSNFRTSIECPGCCDLTIVTAILPKISRSVCGY